MAKISFEQFILLFTGLFLVAMAFVSEFYFHFGLGFSLDNPEIPPELFWKAEQAEALNSITMLGTGVILILAFFWVRKRR